MDPIIGGVTYKNSSFDSRRQGYSAGKPKDSLASVVFNGPATEKYDLKFAEEERYKRQNDLVKRQEVYMKRREAKVLQEAGRWQAVDEDYKRSLQKLEAKRSVWKAGQKNNASEAFNVITLDYDNTMQGDYLRHRDQEKMYREGLRLFNLDSKMNSGYNIINGATRQSPVVPKFIN